MVGGAAMMESELAQREARIGRALSGIRRGRYQGDRRYKTDISEEMWSLMGKYRPHGYRKVCEYCNEAYIGRIARGRYCSVACWKAAKREKRQREAVQNWKRCRACRKMFDAKRGDALYCSNACRQRAYRRRRVLRYG